MIKLLNFKISRVIAVLILSDIFIYSGFGLIAPILAVFYEKNIQGGGLEMIGIASTIYLLTKSLGQLPVAKFVDRIKGEKDDFWVMLIGSIIISIVPMLYLFASLPVHIYLIQFLYGIGQALIFPAWMAIYTKHIDHNQEAMEWGVYYTFIDLGSAIAATVGGIIASKLGFQYIFIFVSLLSVIGSISLLMIRNIYQKSTATSFK